MLGTEVFGRRIYNENKVQQWRVGTIDVGKIGNPWRLSLLENSVATEYQPKHEVFGGLRELWVREAMHTLLPEYYKHTRQ